MSEKEKEAESADATQAQEPAVGEAAPDNGSEDAGKQEGEGEPEAEQQAIAEEDPVEKLKGELAAEKDRGMRLLADFDNYRRRVTREKNETYQRATESTIAEFLPVLDNFDRAISQAPAAGDPFADGVRMVYGQLSEVLAKAGVKPIEALGADFNPAEHEAIAYQPSADAPEGKIIYEARRGYRIGDRVLRPSSVIVSSGAPAKEEAPAEPAADAEKAPETPAEEEK